MKFLVLSMLAFLIWIVTFELAQVPSLHHEKNVAFSVWVFMHDSWLLREAATSAMFTDIIDILSGISEKMSTSYVIHTGGLQSPLMNKMLTYPASDRFVIIGWKPLLIIYKDFFVREKGHDFPLHHLHSRSRLKCKKSLGCIYRGAQRL